MNKAILIKEGYEIFSGFKRPKVFQKEIEWTEKL